MTTPTFYCLLVSGIGLIAMGIGLHIFNLKQAASTQETAE